MQRESLPHLTPHSLGASCISSQYRRKEELGVNILEKNVRAQIGNT